MRVLEGFFRIFMFIAVGILVLGIVQNSRGTARVLNGFSGLLGTGYSAEVAAGHVTRRTG